MKNSLITIVAVFVAATSFGQAPAREVHSREQVWFAYMNQTRLTNKFGLWLDLHYRQTDNFVERPFQLLIRPALTYFIRDNLRANAGYAFINHFPAEGLNTSRPEHRAWQQVWWSQKYTGVNMLQWLRLEQRFNRKIANDVLQDGYNRTNRIRYNVMFSIPIGKKEVAPRTPFIVVSNEIFINFGKNIVYNTFDQNRLSIGMGYQFTSHLNAQLTYMNLYQQEAAGNRYMSNHAIRLFVFHNIDLRNPD